MHTSFNTCYVCVRTQSGLNHKIKVKHTLKPWEMAIHCSWKLNKNAHTYTRVIQNFLPTNEWYHHKHVSERAMFGVGIAYSSQLSHGHLKQKYKFLVTFDSNGQRKLKLILTWITSSLFYFEYIQNIGKQKHKQHTINQPIKPINISNLICRPIGCARKNLTVEKQHK